MSTKTLLGVQALAQPRPKEKSWIGQAQLQWKGLLLVATKLLQGLADGQILKTLKRWKVGPARGRGGRSWLVAEK